MANKILNRFPSHFRSIKVAPRNVWLLIMRFHSVLDIHRNESKDSNEQLVTHPHHTLLQQKGFTFHVYNQFRAKCLKDRAEKGIGQSQVSSDSG